MSIPYLGSLLRSLFTPERIKEAGEQVFDALIMSPAGRGRALEFPVGYKQGELETPERNKEHVENALLLAYLQSRRGDAVVVNQTSISCILQLRDDWVKHTPEGRRMLLDSGRILQKANADELLANAKGLKTE
jgi:hypothetical protein